MKTMDNRSDTLASIAADDEFVRKLELVCNAFDADEGEYPEHKYEGAALLEWLREIRIKPPAPTP